MSEQEAGDRLTEQTKKEGQAAVPNTTPMPLKRYSGVKVAVILALLAGMGWLLHSVAGTGKDELLARSGNNVLVETLPDSSVVTLNKNTSISYPSRFNGATRSVVLAGEAFFSIAPNTQQPFVINAASIYVTTTGTTFNVKCGTEETEIVVETGIVQVGRKQHAINVLPHQKATIAKNSGTPVIEENTDELYNYYRTKEFVCHGTPLSKLVAVLNEAYGAKITIENDSIKNLLLETTFHEEPLSNILKALGTTLHIGIGYRGQEVILK
jgi:transmembrane sensor